MLRSICAEQISRTNSFCRNRLPEARLRFIVTELKMKRPRKISFPADLREIRDILVSATALAFVFSYSGISRFSEALSGFPMALLAVSLGFVLHELAHRYVARKYECRAEYKMWMQGLLLTLAIALVSSGNFVFAALGAVMIYPRVDLWGNAMEISRKRLGLIAVSGPLTNIILSGAFFAAGLFFASPVFMFAVRINIWLALFNLVPFPPLDGSKVFAWDKRVWALAFFAVLGMFLLVR